MLWPIGPFPILKSIHEKNAVLFARTFLQGQHGANVNPIFEEVLYMNCPHSVNETALNVAMCPRCVEFAASYGKALTQSVQFKTEQTRVTALSPASIAVEKQYFGKTA